MKESRILENKIVCYEPDFYDEKRQSIFFCHGLGGSFFSFLKLVDLLKDKYNCFGLDYYGHGKSKGSFKNIKSSSFAKIVKTFIEMKELNKIILIGPSFGSEVISYLEKETFVDKVILIGPILPKIRNFTDVRLILIGLNLLLEEYRNIFRNIFKKKKNTINEGTFMENSREVKKHLLYRLDSLESINLMSKKNLGSLIWRHLQLFKICFSLLNKMEHDVILNNFTSFKKKSLFIIGEKEHMVSINESLIWLNKMVKNSKVVLISGSGHCTHVDALEKTYSIIIDFINE